MLASSDLDDRRAASSREAGVRGVAVADDDNDLRFGADRLRGTSDGAQAASQIGLLVESRHHHGEPRHVPVIGSIAPRLDREFCGTVA